MSILVKHTPKFSIRVWISFKVRWYCPVFWYLILGRIYTIVANLDVTTDVGLIQIRYIYDIDLFKRVSIVATVVIRRWLPTSWRTLAAATRTIDGAWRLSRPTILAHGMTLLSVNTGYGMFQNVFENTHTHTRQCTVFRQVAMKK